MSNRKLTRTGLLEYHYEKYLYGDTSLFQLPEYPQLHILATNLSEGCLCSFNRDGLWMIRREAGHTFRIDHIRIGLATVPMAVAASSAFPGFFPPLELTGADVGARSGEFGRQAYTDGGVFDNLGVRMFRFLDSRPPADQRPWDGVLVSDVGKPFEVQSNLRAGGLIRTAMRASDILMDRVWQLENETFKDTPGFVFARITDIVDPEQDPTALHPEIQRQLPNIRTDLDRFSDIEISSLIRHGYCVGRKACRAHPDVFGADLPANPPWDPIFEARAATPAAAEAPPARSAPARADDGHQGSAHAARLGGPSHLEHAAGLSRLGVVRLCADPRPDPRPVALLRGQVLRAIAADQPDRRVARPGQPGFGTNDAVDGGAGQPWIGESAEELRTDDKAGPDGLPDPARLADHRPATLEAGGGSSNDAGSLVYGYRRLKVRKEPENASNNVFRISVLALSPETQVRFPPQQLKPKLYSRNLDSSARGEKLVHWEVGADFRKVPAGDSVDIIYEHLSPGTFLRDGIGSTTLAFDVEAETVELTRWLLLPEGKEYRTFQ